MVGVCLVNQGDTLLEPSEETQCSAVSTLWTYYATNLYANARKMLSQLSGRKTTIDPQVNQTKKGTKNKY